MTARRPRLGRRIVRGLVVLADVVETSQLLDSPGLFGVGARDRDDLELAREYLTKLAKWCRAKGSRNAPPPHTEDRMTRPYQPVEPRLWEKVEKTDSCWIWKGTKNPKGYGRIVVNGKPKPVHRVTYELVHGPVSDDLHLDHLCRRRDCVRPDHLEPVTNHENALRGARARTHCRNGHPRTPETFGRATLSASHSTCLVCAAEWRARRRAHGDWARSVVA